MMFSIFSFISQRKFLDISCKSSSKQTVHTTFQAILFEKIIVIIIKKNTECRSFSGKNKTTITNLFSAELAHKVAKVNKKSWNLSYL